MQMPFYLMDEQLPEDAEMTGSKNLFQLHGLEHLYSKLCSKKLKTPLSAFLPNIPLGIDTDGVQDNSSLQSLLQPPHNPKMELLPLTPTQLAGFRLHPGPLPDHLRLMSQPGKRKRHRRELEDEELFTPQQQHPIAHQAPPPVSVIDNQLEPPDKKARKQKNEEKSGKVDRKKKKDKRKRKN